MLTITIKGGEQFNEATNEFITVKDQTIKLEHSLVSLSKWEAKWKVPFLSEEQKTKEQTIDYIKCMAINNSVIPDEIWLFISNKNISDVMNYISDPMTATWFNDVGGQKSRNREVITSEIIYYWMVALQIPFECQKWHLNRLLTLVRVCNEKNKPPKKMSKNEILSRNKALNEQRRAKYMSKG